MAYIGVLVPIGNWGRAGGTHYDLTHSGKPVNEHPMWPQDFIAHVDYECVPDETILVGQFHEIAKRLEVVASPILHQTAIGTGTYSADGIDFKISYCELYLYERADAGPSLPDYTVIVATGLTLVLTPEPTARFMFDDQKCLRVA